MTKMKKLIMAAVPVLFSVAISTNLFAVDYVRGKVNMHGEAAGGHDGMGEMALFAKINLTDDQKTRMKALREAHLRDTKPLRDQMFSKRGDLKLLWLQPNPDKEKILAAQKEIRALRDQMEDKATGHHVDMFNTLTPEQQAKTKAMLGKRGAGHGMENRQKMGPGHGMMGNY